MKVIQNLVYSQRGGAALELDLYLPEPAAGTGPLPLLLWVPGGGWANCNKDNTHVWVTEHGFTLAAINYTVSSVATAPANIEDCWNAVRWLRAHAAEYGYDASRIGVFGASAGGHLVALMAAGPAVVGDKESAGIQAVCDICGPTDLTRIAQPEHKAAFEALYNVTQSYLGGPVEEKLAEARVVSPLTYVAASNPPILIVHGDADSVVPVEESHIYHEALQAVGADVELVIAPGAGHGIPLEMWQPQATAFFQRTLGVA